MLHTLRCKYWCSFAKGYQWPKSLLLLIHNNRLILAITLWTGYDKNQQCGTWRVFIVKYVTVLVVEYVTWTLRLGVQNYL